ATFASHQAVPFLWLRLWQLAWLRMELSARAVMASMDRARALRDRRSRLSAAGLRAAGAGPADPAGRQLRALPAAVLPSAFFVLGDACALFGAHPFLRRSPALRLCREPSFRLSALPGTLHPQGPGHRDIRRVDHERLSRQHRPA